MQKARFSSINNVFVGLSIECMMLSKHLHMGTGNACHHIILQFDNAKSLWWSPVHQQQSKTKIEFDFCFLFLFWLGAKEWRNGSFYRAHRTHSSSHRQYWQAICDITFYLIECIHDKQTQCSINTFILIIFRPNGNQNKIAVADNNSINGGVCILYISHHKLWCNSGKFRWFFFFRLCLPWSSRNIINNVHRSWWHRIFFENEIIKTPTTTTKKNKTKKK